MNKKEERKNEKRGNKVPKRGRERQKGKKGKREKREKRTEILKKEKKRKRGMKAKDRNEAKHKRRKQRHGAMESGDEERRWRALNKGEQKGALPRDLLRVVKRRATTDKLPTLTLHSFLHLFLMQRGTGTSGRTEICENHQGS